MSLRIDLGMFASGVVIPFMTAALASGSYLTVCRLLNKPPRAAAVATGLALSLLLGWQLGVEGSQVLDLTYGVIPAYAGFVLAIIVFLLTSSARPRVAGE